MSKYSVFQHFLKGKNFKAFLENLLMLTAHTSLNSYIPGTHKLNILAYAVCMSDILAPICLFKSTSYTSSRDLLALVGWDSVMTSINLKQARNESLTGSENIYERWWCLGTLISNWILVLMSAIEDDNRKIKSKVIKKKCQTASMHLQINVYIHTRMHRWFSCQRKNELGLWRNSPI